MLWKLFTHQNKPKTCSGDSTPLAVPLPPKPRERTIEQGVFNPGPQSLTLCHLPRKQHVGIGNVWDWRIRLNTLNSVGTQFFTAVLGVFESQKQPSLRPPTQVSPAFGCAAGGGKPCGRSNTGLLFTVFLLDTKRVLCDLMHVISCLFRNRHCKHSVYTTSKHQS